MAAKLKECRGTTVGVVGLAHLDGIERYWSGTDLVTV